MQRLYLPVLATYNPPWLLHCLDTGQDLVLLMDVIHTLLFKVIHTLLTSTNGSANRNPSSLSSHLTGTDTVHLDGGMPFNYSFKWAQ